MANYDVSSGPSPAPTQESSALGSSQGSFDPPTDSTPAPTTGILWPPR